MRCSFVRQVTLPRHVRGTERAGVVCAVLDGAPWLQELVDHHRPDAVRILDFAHAVGQLAQLASLTTFPKIIRRTQGTPPD